MSASKPRQAGGRSSFSLFSASCCAVQPRTNSDSSLGRDESPRVEQAQLGVELVGPSAGGGSAAAAEARDQLQPLPFLNHRGSVNPRSNRGSVVFADRHPKASFGATAGTKRAAFPSRTLGSLTAWQMLAADVQQEMEQATTGRGSARLSDRVSGAAVNYGRSSAVEPALIMVSEDSEEPLQPLGEACASEMLQPGSGVGLQEAENREGGRLQAEYEVLGELGRGAFGCALKARRRVDGALVCLKVQDTRAMGATERRMTRDEVRVLSSLLHPNIVQYNDCFFEAGQQYITLELCEEGDLEKLLKARGGVLLSEEEVMLKFVQLCLALQHVHGKGILHRDIKTSNIFVSRHGILKLGDFGVSKVIAPGKSYAKTMVGTPLYMSPEVVEDKPYNKKSDCWAAGCVLYELATLQRPFKGSSVSAIAVKILRGSYTPLPEQFSPELHQLVAALLRRKPDQRPSIDEVLRMDYMRQAMRLYRDHVVRTVDNRKASYFHSLDAFQLDAATPEFAAALLLQQRQSVDSRSVPVPAFDCQAQASVQGRSGSADLARVGAAGELQLPGTGTFNADTMVVKPAAAEQIPSADLASALAAAGPLAAPNMAERTDRRAVATQAQPWLPRYSTFSAVQHLARLEHLAGGKPPSQGASPSSPRTALSPGFNSLETTVSGAFVCPASAAMLDGAASAASANDGTSSEEAGEGGRSLADHPVAESVGDLARHAAALIQVEQLLEANVGNDGIIICEDDDVQRQRSTRRAAVQECAEELGLHVLPPPAFPQQ